MKIFLIDVVTLHQCVYTLEEELSSFQVLWNPPPQKKGTNNTQNKRPHLYTIRVGFKSTAFAILKQSYHKIK